MTARIPVLAALALLFIVPCVSAQDHVFIGGTARTGAAGAYITVPVFLHDMTGTAAGRDQAASGQITNLAFRVTFSDATKVAGCDVEANCTFTEAGLLADVRPLGVDDPATSVFEPCETAGTGCFFRSIARTADSLAYVLARRAAVATTGEAVPGDLIGYVRIKLAPGFAGSLDVRLEGDGAFLGGTDNATGETVANTRLGLDAAFTQTSLLDADAAGGLAALTDGLLILRRLFGFTGTTLVNGAIGTGSQRSGGIEVGAYISSLGTAIDVDGDGAMLALTDGLLILRYLFGFRGATLINGAVGTGATRTTAPQIESFLGAL